MVKNNGERSVADETPIVWLLAADRRHARLLSAQMTEHGRLHVDLHAVLEEEWDEHQHGRPSSRNGKSGHSNASKGHEEEERTHRFAKEVASWLEGELDSRKIAHVQAFCARQLLGELRRVLPKRMHEHIIDHALDLANFSTGDLAEHSAIIKATDLEFEQARAKAEAEAQAAAG